VVPKVRQLILRSRPEKLGKLKKELYDIISHHTGQEYDKVYADSERDYWMRADEAREYGMIDSVMNRKPKK